MKTRLLSLVLLGTAAAFGGNGQWTVVAWNNLGMHCMDDDYSVFSILPPYNTVNAQVIDATGKLVTNPLAAGITVTYESCADPDGSLNTTAAGKTNFYQYCQALFGANLAVDQGLAGNPMPGSSNIPRPMNWVSGMNWFEALGIPICPTDDSGRKNPYPMMRVSARNAAGNVLASADVVLPVSDEMDCRACHASGSGPAARPAAGWVTDPDGKRDFRLNILRLHDEQQASNPLYATALAQTGYSSQGLYQGVVADHKPVLCAACHASEALAAGGVAGVPPLTRAMHAKHATVVNPADGLMLNNIASRNSCYVCHPGSATRCLRGAMGSAINPADGTMTMQCQSCHGSMSEVGSSHRTGWLDEPNCQGCHTGDAVQNDGNIRFPSVFASPGVPRTPANQRFATNPNTPLAGTSLFRYSHGHGGLACSACHGSTHAEFPSSHRNDNLYALQKQGHKGKLATCTACHATMPANNGNGPHGLHPIASASWVKEHHDKISSSGGLQNCQRCHGTDYRGTPLSRVEADCSIATEKFGTVVLKRGMEVGCYQCHDGAQSSRTTSKLPPTVAGGQLAVPVNTPTSVTLTASGTAPVLRIVEPPLHGSIALSGLVATYFPDSGYQGPDSFTYLASDSGGYRDSLPALWSITVGATDPQRDSDGDGLPDLLEHALGSAPDFPTTNGAASPFLRDLSGQRYLSLRCNRSPSPADVNTAVEFSSDLKHWVPGTVIADTPWLLDVRDPSPTSANAQRFVRLKTNR